MDVTDHNVTDEELEILKNLSKQNPKLSVQNTNWFGGVWSLEDFIHAEEELNKFVMPIKSKNFSVLEELVLAYHFAAEREYNFAPKGSPFQFCRSYVDVLCKGYCVCVGFATVFMRLCEKFGIPCGVQGCLVKDKFGKVVNHANNIVFVKDEKYDICALVYADPRMDCKGFLDDEKFPHAWKLNMFAVTLTDIGKIQIKVWNDDSIIEMNDFQSIYYTKKPNDFDLEYFSKFFHFKNVGEIMAAKYAQPITFDKIELAMKNLGLSQEIVSATKGLYHDRKKQFFAKSFESFDGKEWEIRLNFAHIVADFLKHGGRKIDKMDCATFVVHLFRNFFGQDVTEGGIGQSWTGKILTSKKGEFKSVDEKADLKDKIRFVDTKCKVGDVLLFHTQSKSQNETNENNFFPGHCGIYLGNHKYADARLTTRGYADFVDMENDIYMDKLIGAKDFISTFVLEQKKSLDFGEGEMIK